MKVEELREEYLAMLEKQRVLASLKKLGGDSWEGWQEPFRAWTEEYMENCKKRKAVLTYKDMINIFFLQKITDLFWGRLSQLIVENHFVDDVWQIDNGDVDNYSVRIGAHHLQELIAKLLTTFIYESRRGQEGSQELCAEITGFFSFLQRLYGKIRGHNSELFNLLDSIVHAKSIFDKEQILKQIEATKKTYFGSYLSDNSDSDEEVAMGELPEELSYRNFIAKQYCDARVDYFPVTARGDKLYDKPQAQDLNPRWRINQANLTLEKYKDLETLNELLREGLSIEEASKKITTKFFIAQYRGIAYSIHRWSKVSRKKHREWKEVSQPHFSLAVYRAIGIQNFRDFFLRLDAAPAVLEQLQEKALELEAKFLPLREVDQPYVRNGYLYSCKAHYFQYEYTRNYKNFVDVVVKELPDAAFHDNPFVSTGSIPKHALEYAYGRKFYKGSEGSRLRPRWRANGRAERPYLGKVYVSLHPLEDYDPRRSSNVLSLGHQGAIPVVLNAVVHEREVSFPVWLQRDRVILEHRAKVPSFVGDYKEIYLYKYGLTEDLYNKFKAVLAGNASTPHGVENEAKEQLLVDWLCCFHEARLIDQARRHAESLGGVLIYQKQDGTFSFETDNSADIGMSPIQANERKRINELMAFRKAMAVGLAKNDVENPTEDELIDILNEFHEEEEFVEFDVSNLKCMFFPSSAKNRTADSVHGALSFNSSAESSDDADDEDEVVSGSEEAREEEYTESWELESSAEDEDHESLSPRPSGGKK